MRFDLAVVALGISALLIFSCAEFKQAGRDIGHGTRDVVKAIGEESRDVYEEVKKDIHEATAD